MVQGVAFRAGWKSSIRAKKLAVIFSGAADHRQYPNQEEDRRIEVLKDPEFESYRRMALEEGFALEKPSTFFIQHVYPSTVGKLPKMASRVRFVESLLKCFMPDRSLEEWPQRVVTQIMRYLE